MPLALVVQWLVASLANTVEWLPTPLCPQATSKEQSIRITSSGGLSDDQIESMVREGEENAAKDKEVGDCKAEHDCSTMPLQLALLGLLASSAWLPLACHTTEWLLMTEAGQGVL